MQNVTQPGPQRPLCCVESCMREPAKGDVMCAGHLGSVARGEGQTPPIVEPDDPARMEALAREAAAAELEEYAQRGMRVDPDAMGRGLVMAAKAAMEDRPEWQPDPAVEALRHIKRCLKGKEGGLKQQQARAMVMGMAWALGGE